MKRLSLSLFVVLFFGAGFLLNPAQAQTYVQLVLDASGSMWNKLDDGTYRIMAAKDVLGNFIKGLPTGDLNVGLRIYGANIGAMDAGACDDIALVVPMEGVDKPVLQSAVDATKAKGATPIVKALELAAADFPAEAEKKLIVLVTDGEESCGGDLNAIAEKLEAQGIEIDLKIIGFALSERAQQSFAGVGEFVNAADAEQLASALEGAVEEVVVEEVAPVVRETVTLTVPATAPAGQYVDVSYDGADLQSLDYLTLVPVGSEDGVLANYIYVNLDTKTSKLTTSFEPGAYEVRYLDDAGTVLARAAITLEKSDITMRPLGEIYAGSEFEVEWTGPNGESDYITIVKADAPDGQFNSYVYTSYGAPLKLTAGVEPGQYELRYQTDRSSDSGKVFARVPVEVLEAVPVFLQAAPEAVGGTDLEIEWAGPTNESDIITIVPASAEERAYKDYKYAKDVGSPMMIAVPVEPGDYEVRYLNDREGKVLGRIPLKVTGSTSAVTVVSEAMAGTLLEVTVTGSTGDSDFVTIVKADAGEGSYNDYYYTQDKMTGMLQTSFEPGSYEARLVNEREGKVVARTPLTLTAPQITLQAPSEVAVNSDFEVSYTAPASERSFIAIVPATAGESEYGSSYAYTTGASGSVQLRAPETAGSYEIRYLTPENKAIYKIPITVK